MPALVEDMAGDTGKVTVEDTVWAVITGLMVPITAAATAPAGNKLQPAA